MPVPTPTTILEAIATDADPGTINPIPDAPPGGSGASVQKGFPLITMTPEVSGGTPPLGPDMNGMLNLISQHTFAVQCGVPYLFNAPLATAIGGYPAGVVLGMATGTGLWLNAVANNSNNPDTSGAGWIPISAYGVTSVATTGGTTALTGVQAALPIITITGALTSNAIIQVPNRFGQWLFVNATTGAHTVTIANFGGGSGTVNVPQGGYASPVGVYSIGDNNAYPVVTPLSVSIDQNATPLTLLERTNTGAGIVTQLIQTVTPTNIGIGDVLCDNGSNGTVQRVPLANFLPQLVTQVAGNPGYIKLPGGIIFQWQRVSKTASATVSVSFPIPFPTQCFVPVFCDSGSPNGYVQRVVPGSLTASGFQIQSDTFDGAQNPTITVLIISVGN